MNKAQIYSFIVFDRELFLALFDIWPSSRKRITKKRFLFELLTFGKYHLNFTTGKTRQDSYSIIILYLREERPYWVDMSGTSHFWSRSRWEKRFRPSPDPGEKKFWSRPLQKQILVPVPVKNILVTVPVQKKTFWSRSRPGPGQKKKFGPGTTLPISSIEYSLWCCPEIWKKKFCDKIQQFI
jgi:hypothetical protein